MKANIHTIDQDTRQLMASRLFSQGVDISAEDLRQRPPCRKQQHNFTHQIMTQSFNALLNDSDEEAKARIKASIQKGAQNFLTALPTSSSKKFTDDQWRLAVRLRLGLATTRRKVPRVCPLCNELVESAGAHPFTCRYADMMNYRHDRHDRLRDTLLGFLSAWGFSPRREPVIQRGCNLRGDIEVVQTDGPCILDVSVIHPTALRTQQNLTPAAGTRIQEKVKEDKYRKICDQTEKNLVPFVFQSYGGIGERGQNFLADLRNRPAFRQVFQPGNFVDSIRTGLSCRFMRFNANLISRWLQLVLPPSSGGVASSLSA